MKKVRGSYSCAELGKTQFFPVGFVKCTVSICENSVRINV